MNRGAFGNTAVGRFERVALEVRCAGTGGETQPFFDTFNGTYQYGRYVLDPRTNIVHMQMQVAFVGATTVGAGSAFVFRLPFKARRFTKSGAVDPTPIGTAMCYWSFIGGGDAAPPSANLPCVVTLANPYTSLGGAEDHYCQLYAPQLFAWSASGGESWVSGTTYTITHGLGQTPQQSDIYLVGTNGGLGVAQGFIITATGTQGATVSNRAGTAPAATQTFRWRVEMEPPSGSTTAAVVGPFVPWDWSVFTSLGPFGNIFIDLEYEAA